MCDLTIWLMWREYTAILYLKLYMLLLMMAVAIDSVIAVI